MEVTLLLGKLENKRLCNNCKSDEPKQIKENVFRVPSQNSEKYYYVLLTRMVRDMHQPRSQITGRLPASISMQ